MVEFVNDPDISAPSPTVPITVVAGGAAAASVIGAASAPAGVSVIAPAALLDAPAGAGRIVTVADVAERSPGCPCCRSRLDLVDGLVRLARRRQRPDRIVVGLEPSDDVVTALRTILAEPELARLVRLERVVVTVDAVALATRLASDLPFGDQLLLDRLAIADAVLVARSGDLGGASSERLLATLRTIARFGTVHPLPQADRPGRAVCGPDRWHGSPDLEPNLELMPVRVDDGDVVPDTVVLEQAGALDSDGTDDWLNGIIARHGRRLLRLQGVLAVAGLPWRVCCRAVGSAAMSHPELEHPPGTRPQRPGPARSTVVITGRALDAADLAAGLDAARAR